MEFLGPDVSSLLDEFVQQPLVGAELSAIPIADALPGVGFDGFDDVSRDLVSAPRSLLLVRRDARA